MKRNSVLSPALIILSVISIVFFSGCASKQKLQKERSETFIADLDGFYVDELYLYTRLTISSPKISDFEIYFYPRSNYINLKTKIGVDYLMLDFSYEERQKLYEASQKYLEAYNNNSITEAKPKKKNAFYTSSIPLGWGVLGYSHSTVIPYMANIEFLEKDKPYFLLKFESITDSRDNSTSPAFSIYISPSQWQKIFEICNQEALEAQVDNILEQAEAF